MDPNSEWDAPSPFSEEEEAEMATVVGSDLEARYRELSEKYQRLGERLSEFRQRNTAMTQRITQLNLELETCRNNFQELNLLDGFLRSGAVRALNLESDPTLKVLLTSFLARALQTALDTGAVQFPNPRRSGD
jgi:predicted RNase H-like nuclease (RuvC/YqgF family)